MNQYETMFLFDPTFASDFGNAKEEVERILKRAEAEIVFLEKWEERKLAYEIKGRKRGCYVLVYYNCAAEKIKGIERDAQLSEPVLRILVKRADGITPEHIAKFMPQARAAEEDDAPIADDRDDSKKAAETRDDKDIENNTDSDPEAVSSETSD